MILIRKILARITYHLFGTLWVVLIDFNGDANIRRVVEIGTRWYAWRVGMGIRKVELGPNGEVINGAYVDSWEPYYPPANFPAKKERRIS